MSPISVRLAFASAVCCLALVIVGCAGPRATAPRVDAFAQWVVDQAGPSVTTIVSGESSTRLLDPPPAMAGPVPVGSVTKLLTAMLVLQGVEAGLYDLDDPVPGLAHPAGEDMTWRHLLEHRGGFVDRRMDPTQPEAAMPIVPPGVLHVYSNEGYATLAGAMETAWGSSYEVLARERVFEPLGMQDVRLNVHAARGSWAPPVGASGLEGSPEDLALLAAAMARRDPRILTRQGWETLFDLDMWDRSESARQGGGRPRMGFVQEGRVTGSRATLVALPRARAAVLLLFDEENLEDVENAESQALRIQGEAIRRWGERTPLIRVPNLNPLALFRPRPCLPCDWSERVGIYLSPYTGDQVIITEINGGPSLVEQNGEVLSIGPELSDGRSAFHDLYDPISDSAPDEFNIWSRRADSRHMIEFGRRDGRVLGLLRGADWYERVGD